jgi:hypothetical protein
MGMKYQMTRQGMQSMYTLAWHGVTERGARDPMFSSPDPDLETDPDEMLLEAEVVTPGRLAPLESALRAQAESERVLARREADLLRLGYLGF